MNFASDNAAAIAPDILAAIARANEGAALAYGNDDWTRRVERRFAELFEHEVAVFLVATGTAANAVSSREENSTVAARNPVILLRVKQASYEQDNEAMQTKRPRRQRSRRSAGLNLFEFLWFLLFVFVGIVCASQLKRHEGWWGVPRVVSPDSAVDWSARTLQG